MRAELSDPSSLTWAQRDELRLLHSKTSGQAAVPPTIIGTSRALTRLVEVAERVAKRNAKVLITGESGVGKDVIARFIHACSARADQRFVALNCAAFSETLLESELFGHVKGSFTGAYRDKIGKLQQAHRGTIFLDEIAEMSLRMQALLLRFLEDGEIQPVGSDAPPIRADVRVLSATNRDLTEMVAKGEFREDLLYRIKVAHIQVPPLRDRKDDIRALIEHTLTRCVGGVVIAEEAIVLLERYRWPGNVRELQNVIEQMVAMVEGDEIGLDDLPPMIGAPLGSNAYPRRDRRRRLSDEIYEALVSGGKRFWEDVHTMFTNRDITRADLRQVIRRGLAATGGNYRGVLQLFGMESQDYKKLMNFLAAHDCIVNYREFREMKHDTGLRSADVPRAADQGV
jgi:transcriptional regulator with PAS, ATPase and Fis domain